MIVNTEQFHYDPVANHYTTNASDVIRDGDDLFHRFYNEITEGVILVSKKIGLVVGFDLDHIEVDEEGEVLYYELTPDTEAIKNHKRLFNAKMTIFND
jgi:hypothetical protein